MGGRDALCSTPLCLSLAILAVSLLYLLLYFFLK
ncbi:hypothetical protein ABIE49_003592 [Bradyrhizobium sp. OAE829]